LNETIGSVERHLSYLKQPHCGNDSLIDPFTNEIIIEHVMYVTSVKFCLTVFRQGVCDIT